MFVDIDEIHPITLTPEFYCKMIEFKNDIFSTDLVEVENLHKWSRVMEKRFSDLMQMTMPNGHGKDCICFCHNEGGSLEGQCKDKEEHYGFCIYWDCC